MKTFLLNMYRKRFEKSIFVLKVSGKLAKKSVFAPIAADIRELRQAGIQVVLVHGGGQQIDALLMAQNIEVMKHNGRRITDLQTLSVVQQTVGGTINQAFTSQLLTAGVDSVGINGADATMVQVQKRPVTEQGVDFGFVGDVRSIKPKLIKSLLKSDFVPVIGCLGIDAQGQIYNVNADTIATEIAIALKAEKLIFFTDTNGILNAKKERISVLKTSEMQPLIDKKTIAGGMQVKVNNAKKAVTNGVKRVHVIAGKHSHALHDEIFSLEGIGTMIVTPEEAKKYQSESQA